MMDRQALTAKLRLPSRRETLQTVCIAFAIAAICWYFGVDAWHSILLGAAITVVMLAIAAGSNAPLAENRSSGHDRKRAGGSRSDVAMLSGSLRVGWGTVGLPAEGRLHKIAVRRLALEGLYLDNPAHREPIERRIGTRAYRSLTRSTGRGMRLRTLIYCLDVLDTLDHNHYPGGNRER